MKTKSETSSVNWTVSDLPQICSFSLFISLTWSIGVKKKKKKLKLTFTKTKHPTIYNRSYYKGCSCFIFLLESNYVKCNRDVKIHHKCYHKLIIGIYWSAKLLRQSEIFSPVKVIFQSQPKLLCRVLCWVGGCLFVCL